MQAIEFNTKLLKLHFRWPDREELNGSENEAVSFTLWLLSDCADLPEVEALMGVEQVEEFLIRNKGVLQSITEETPAKPFNARTEPRIENDVRVVLSVDECQENVELVGVTSNGRTVDLGLHGMQISIDKKIPVGAILSLLLQTDDGDIFDLLGEAKWVSSSENGQVMGLRIIESKGFEAWHRQFGEKFVAPRIARVNEPKPEIEPDLQTDLDLDLELEPIDSDHY
jgi:hypothetical protein